MAGAFFAPSEKQDRKVLWFMVYDTGKIFVNKFCKFKRYSIRPYHSDCIGQLNYLIYIFLRSWRLIKAHGVR